jgi:multiple sugar transport system ATP-binding protein
MRTSLQQLHSRLGTTTVYVTHDQVEAMTLGQRVAVMRDGVLQQVDAPQRLYERPTNVFVAAFIGSPSMNLLPGTIADDTLAIGSLTIPLDRDRRPSFAGPVTVGLRPEAFEDAAFAPSGLPQHAVRVEVEEELGSDTYVFFSLDVDPIVIEEAVSENKDEDTTTLTASDRSLFVARVNARSRAEVGDVLTLVIDPSQLYFFSPETGQSLLDGRLAAASAG